MGHIVSNSLRNGRGGKEENCGVTSGLSKSERTEDGTERDYTVSILMVNW